MDDYDDKQLEPIKQLAQQLAQALRDRNARTIAPAAIIAVTKYGEIAGALMVSTQEQPPRPDEAEGSMGVEALESQAAQYVSEVVEEPVEVLVEE